MGKFLERGVVRSWHLPRRGTPLNPNAAGVVVPGFLVPAATLSSLRPFAREFATVSGVQTSLMNDNGRGHTLEERAARVADTIAEDPHTRDVEGIYLVGHSRGGTLISGLAEQLKERGYKVLAAGYLTPRGMDDTSVLHLTGTLVYDMTTTVVDTLTHLRTRGRSIPQLVYSLANSISGAVVKTVLGEIFSEVGECARKNTSNQLVTSPVVVVYAANDKIADYRNLLKKGVTYEDIEMACEFALQQEFPNASYVRVIIVPDERHVLSIVEPKKTAELVFDAMTTPRPRQRARAS